MHVDVLASWLQILQRQCTALWACLLSQDAQRVLLGALNGLAGVLLLEGKTLPAIAAFREVLSTGACPPPPPPPPGHFPQSRPTLHSPTHFALACRCHTSLANSQSVPVKICHSALSCHGGLYASDKRLLK